MKCTILHETRGRMRVHTMQGAMSLQQADILEAYLNRTPGVTKATVYDRRFFAAEREKGKRSHDMASLPLLSFVEVIRQTHRPRSIPAR